MVINLGRAIRAAAAIVAIAIAGYIAWSVVMALATFAVAAVITAAVISIAMTFAIMQKRKDLIAALLVGVVSVGIISLAISLTIPVICLCASALVYKSSDYIVESIDAIFAYEIFGGVFSRIFDNNAQSDIPNVGPSPVKTAPKAVISGPAPEQTSAPVLWSMGNSMLTSLYTVASSVVSATKSAAPAV